VVARAAEASEVDQALWGAVERHAHAIEQIDNRWGALAHTQHGRLVRQKVAAVNRVVEVDPRRVALAFGVHCAVDAALRTHRVRALHRHKREQIHMHARLRELHRGHQTA
jgi:hypothetical protein